MTKRQHFLKNKKNAQKLILSRIEFFVCLYGVKVKRVTVRNQKTRWGSCSRLGNLNFNYKIIFLPQRYLDYVLVHELCHLLEFNHSKRFWFHVARTFPDYKQIRKDLQKVNMVTVGNS